MNILRFLSYSVPTSRGFRKITCSISLRMIDSIKLRCSSSVKMMLSILDHLSAKYLFSSADSSAELLKRLVLFSLQSKVKWLKFLSCLMMLQDSTIKEMQLFLLSIYNPKNYRLYEQSSSSLILFFNYKLTEFFFSKRLMCLIYFC